MMSVAARGQDDSIHVAATQPLKWGIAIKAWVTAQEVGRLHPRIMDVHGTQDSLQSGQDAALFKLPRWICIPVAPDGQADELPRAAPRVHGVLGDSHTQPHFVTPERTTLGSNDFSA